MITKKILIILFLIGISVFVFNPIEASAALTPGSTSNSGTSALWIVASGHWHHTTVAGEDSLWVHLSFAFQSITSVTFDGVAMTLAVAKTDATYRSAWYYLANPHIGADLIIEVTFTTGANNARGAGGAIAFKGTNTTTPLGATAVANGSSNNPTQSLTTTVVNSYVLQGIITDGSEGTPTGVTPGANETEIYELQVANQSHCQASDKTATSVGSYTMSETLAGNATWLMSLLEVKASAAKRRIFISLDETLLKSVVLLTKNSLFRI